MLEEREYQFLEVLSRNGGYSQRRLASSMGLSLGLTNLILKRLVQKGYIKARGLNKKKMRYLLTQHGFTEKLKKSYHYTLRTIKELGSYKGKIQNFILQEYDKGQRKFGIQGSGELSDIAEMAMKSIKRPELYWERTDGSSGEDDIMLDNRTKIRILKLITEEK